MRTYILQSPVILFNHKEYGQRLLFQKGTSNPRDKLGKNGITFHNNFASIFHKTIRLSAVVIDESGKKHTREFNINRNSLVKYLGHDSNISDDEIINKLHAQLWQTDNNEDLEQKLAQVRAGQHGLRHAGRHNQRPVNSWKNALSDFIKGSFLSWLYQKTIQGVHLIKVRFLLVRTEKNLFEAGEILAKKRFHEAYSVGKRFQKPCANS